MFIVKVPGVNNPENINGCRNSGNAIIEELRKLSFNESGEKIDANSLEFEEIHVDNSNLEESNNLIQENSLEIFETKPKSIFLGGDHSISYPILAAFLDYCSSSKKKPCLIVFDAHLDLSEPSGIPNNHEWLKGVLEKGFPPENILVAGARNFSETDFNSIEKSSIKIVRMNGLLENLEETCDFIMEFSLGKELYMSIDMNVIDPAFAPSVLKPEPGGLTSREFIYLIQRIKKIKNLRAVDITEINSDADKNKENLTIKLGAKIVSELL